MGIVDEDIAKVREATDLVAVVTEYTQLRKVGQRWSGLCPFHSEKSPSFSVNGVDGLYHCFGCKASGDAITFVREIEHLDFVGAVEWLAARAGVTLHYTDKNESEGRKRQARLFELTERAAAWYHDRLRTGPDAAAARGYLRSRGFDAEEVAAYRIGWAPDGWDVLCRALGAPIDDLDACGLGFTNRAGRAQDFFRARILFPIIDERDRVIGFGGRKLPDGEGPKYQNSRDNVLYNKSKALYGINWARTEVVQANQVVVCEGYTDVIGFARAGLRRAVATCGTSLTEDHVRTLKRFTRHLVLAYDADEAGQSAAERVYAWERAHDIEFSVVDLPPGTDPDELARTDPDRLRAAVESPKRFLRFRMDRVLATADLSTAEGRARAADGALQVIAEHPDELVRDQYLMDLEGPTRIGAEQLRHRLGELLRAPRRPAAPAGGDRRGGGRRDGVGGDRGRDGGGRDGGHREGGRRDGSGDRRDAGPRHDGPGGPGYDDEPLPPEPGGAAGPSAPVEDRPVALPPLGAGVEREALRVAVADPSVAEAFMFPELFLHPTARAAFDALTSASSVAEAVERSAPPVAELLAEVAVAPATADPGDVLARLASESARRALLELEAEARGAPDPLEYADVIAWLKVTLDHLRQPRAEVETVTQLLAFLRDGGTDADGE